MGYARADRRDPDADWRDVEANADFDEMRGDAFLSRLGDYMERLLKVVEGPCLDVGAGAVAGVACTSAAGSPAVAGLGD